MELKKTTGRPKGKERKQVSTKLCLHTVDSLNQLVEETGRSKNDLLDLAVDYYYGQTRNDK